MTASPPARVVLTTQRLVLREFSPGDAAFIVRLLNDPGWLQHIGDRNVRTDDDARAYLERGEPKLIAASREDYRQIFKDAFVDPPYAPDFLLNSLADAQVARRGEYLRMYQQFWGRRTPLEPLLPGLAMPALLLWGDQDKILDVSAAQVFKQGLPHVEAVIWPNVGHAPMLEKAADSARLYAGFIGRYPVR